MRIIIRVAGYLLLMITLSACAINTVVQNKTRVNLVTEGTTLQGYLNYYALPRTVMDVQVVVNKPIFKPGPFVDYAERFLGITGAQTRDRTSYEIKEIRVLNHPEKDPEQVYVITTEGTPVGARLTLTPEGILAGVNLPWQPENVTGPTSTVKIREDDFYFPAYPDLSIHKNIRAVADTTYWTVRTDTSFMRIPILKHKDAQKTLPIQVEEAANTIYKIRKRRFYLLNGIYAYDEKVRTPMPDGEALDVIVRELNQMEYEYLSLFVGRTQTEELEYTYSYTPNGKGLTEAKTLFSFSEQRGVLPDIDTSGEPVRLQLTRTANNVMDRVTQSEEDARKPKMPGLAYRIPEKVKVELFRASTVLFNREMLVAQFGRIDFLPMNLVNDPGTAIEVYPSYGSIKSIYTR